MIDVCCHFWYFSLNRESKTCQHCERSASCTQDWNFRDYIKRSSPYSYNIFHTLNSLTSRILEQRLNTPVSYYVWSVIRDSKLDKHICTIVPCIFPLPRVPSVSTATVSWNSTPSAGFFHKNVTVTTVGSIAAAVVTTFVPGAMP